MSSTRVVQVYWAERVYDLRQGEFETKVVFDVQHTSEQKYVYYILSKQD